MRGEHRNLVSDQVLDGVGANGAQLEPLHAKSHEVGSADRVDLANDRDLAAGRIGDADRPAFQVRRVLHVAAVGNGHPEDRSIDGREDRSHLA